MAVKYIKNHKNKKNFDILIPAAGLGKRMKLYGCKSLIQINSKQTLIEYQLSLINEIFPNCRIILVTGFESELLMSKTPDNILKVENNNYENTNVVKSIGVGLRVCTENVLIIYGDLIFNREVLKSINIEESSIICADHIMDETEVGCTINEKGYVENLLYDLPKKWAQIAFFKNKELKKLKEIAWDNNNSHLYGFEAINKIINDGGKFITSTSDKLKIIDIDTSKDIDKIKDII